MEYSIEVRGVREFMADLATAPAVLEAADFMAMQKSVFLVEAEAKARVPVRTGRLRSSITSQASATEGKVGTSVSYARMMEFGTVPHEIVPVTKAALYWAGLKHPVARVHHPGTRAYEYMGGALEASKDHIVDFFKEAADRLVSHLAGK